MRQRKLKWAEPYLNEASNFIKDDQIDISKVFDNSNLVEVEIGCGKGQFLLRKSNVHPDINYLGFDIADSVLAIACKKLEEAEVSNVKFAHVNAAKLSEILIGKLDTIYLNFSDPWPKKRHAKRRLTSPLMLDEYYKVLNKNGRIIQRTDNYGLYLYTLEVLQERTDFKLIEAIENVDIDADGVISEYEEKFRGLNNPIYKIVMERK